MIPKNNSYYKRERKSISDLIFPGAHKVLDVGCAAGSFGASLKREMKASMVFGIEIFEGAANEASKQLDEVICANLDDLDIDSLCTNWGQLSFDYIIYNDVLEHTKDPWKIIASFKPLLKPSGKIIVSLPNVRHWTIIFPLLFKGDWRYVDAGIMDRTHLRFFTKKTGRELIEQSGLKVIKSFPLIGGRWRTISKLSFGILDEFLAIQYVYLADIKS